MRFYAQSQGQSYHKVTAAADLLVLTSFRSGAFSFSPQRAKQSEFTPAYSFPQFMKSGCYLKHFSAKLVGA